MDRATLLDRSRWGMNIAALTMGVPTDLFRPRGVRNPLAPENRMMRMHAAFTPRTSRSSRGNLYGDPLWLGIFDAAYTRVGDYLVQPEGTYFIAAQKALAEPLCVQTNRRLTISRAIPPGLVGENGYGGIIAGNNAVLMEGWPASVLGVQSTGSPTAALPSDMSVPYLSILLPQAIGIVLQINDLIADDLGRGAVIGAAELTDMGWRITAKQASA